MNDSKRPPKTPPKRIYHSMVYDGKTDRILLFGGQAYYHWGMDLQDVWAYEVATAKWAFLGALEAGEVYAAAYDEASERVIMVNLKGETWAYSIRSQGWEKRHPPTTPAARYGHRMTFEAHTGRIILFGGFKGGSIDEPLFNDTWAYEYEADRWTLMEPALQPPARIYHSMVYHPAAKRTLVWGGRPFEARGDLSMWAYDSHSNTWESLEPGKGPNYRLVYAPMVYSQQLNRVILFGGLELTGEFEGRITNEIWLYDLEKNSWTQVEAASGPSARSQHAMTYAPTLGKAIVFGGEVGGAYAGVFTDELWFYDLAANQWNFTYP